MGGYSISAGDAITALPVTVEQGGTEATSLTDGGVLLGSGTDAITAMGVLADGSIIIGDGTTDPTTLAAFTSSTGALKVANGGTAVTSAGITAFNNITGYSAAGATGTTSTNLVFSTSPVLTTPTLGAASATSINFGGTSLANYVEGTFTPTVTGPATVPVYSTNTGRYTRIGNRVFAAVYLTGDGGNEGNGTGQISIALPVTANASQPAGYFPCGQFINNVTTGALFGSIAGGGSTIALQYSTIATNPITFDGNAQNNATRTISLSFSYEA